MSTGVAVLDRSFSLPPQRHATTPPEARGLARDEVRLLVAQDGIVHARFRELPGHLRAGDLVVVNNSAVMTAAVDARLGELPLTVHFSTWLDDGRWVVEIRSAERAPFPDDGLDAGTELLLADGSSVVLARPWLPPARRLWVARTTVDPRVSMASHGRPITYSYVPQRWSADYYTTVFGRLPGSAEMPSAARPFTDRLVLDLLTSGIAVAPVTLHTGVSSRRPASRRARNDSSSRPPPHVRSTRRRRRVVASSRSAPPSPGLSNRRPTGKDPRTPGPAGPIWCWASTARPAWSTA